MSTTTPKTAEEVLKVAAGWIRERGLGKEVYEAHPGGPVCILGAIRLAVYGSATAVPHAGDGHYETYLTAHSLVSERLGVDEGYGEIATWNDADGRTGAEVIAMLEGQTP